MFTILGSLPKDSKRPHKPESGGITCRAVRGGAEVLQGGKRGNERAAVGGGERRRGSRRSVRLSVDRLGELLSGQWP